MSNQREYANRYFWRTYTGTEIDYVEEYGGRLYGFEFKWGKRSARVPSSWIDTYPNARFQGINSDNYLDFIAGKL